MLVQPVNQVGIQQVCAPSPWYPSHRFALPTVSDPLRDLLLNPVGIRRARAPSPQHPAPSERVAVLGHLFRATPPTGISDRGRPCVAAAAAPSPGMMRPPPTVLIRPSLAVQTVADPALRLRLRPGAARLVCWAHRRGVPLVVYTAGLTNVVREVHHYITTVYNAYEGWATHLIKFYIDAWCHQNCHQYGGWFMGAVGRLYGAGLTNVAREVCGSTLYYPGMGVGCRGCRHRHTPQPRSASRFLPIGCAHLLTRGLPRETPI